MNLLTDLLTFLGFLAITFGTAGTISRWFKAAEERKRDAAENHRQVTAALARIEESIRRIKP